MYCTMFLSSQIFHMFSCDKSMNSKCLKHLISSKFWHFFLCYNDQVLHDFLYYNELVIHSLIASKGNEFFT